VPPGRCPVSPVMSWETRDNCAELAGRTCQSRDQERQPEARQAVSRHLNRWLTTCVGQLNPTLDNHLKGKMKGSDGGGVAANIIQFL